RWRARSALSRRRYRGRGCDRYRPRSRSRRLGGDDHEVLVDLDLRGTQREIEELERPFGDGDALDFRDIALHDMLCVPRVPPGQLRLQGVEIDCRLADIGGPGG